MTAGKRLKEARLSNKLTMGDVEAATGITKGNISSFENDRYKPSAEPLVLLSKLYKVSIDWILTGAETTQPSPITDDISLLFEELPEIDKIKIRAIMEYKVQEYKEEKEKQIEENRKIVPFAPQEKPETKSVLLRGLSSAGSPLHHFDDLFYTDTDYVETEEMRADFAWKISGNSMEPLIEDGEIIFTRSVDKNEISNGDIVVVRVNGEYTCKKIYVDLKKQKITLRSVNPNYPDQIYYFGDDTDTIIRIEGKVL